MAKVYNSRSLIDPNMYSVMNQQIQNRVANQLNRDKMLGDSVRHMLTGIGETTDDYIGRYQRQKELQNAEANKDSLPYIEDPIYRAAREEYIRTGSSQPISSYMLQKEATKARTLEAKKRNDEQERIKWNQEQIALRDDQNKYQELTSKALDAQAAGDYTTAQFYTNQAKALEAKYADKGMDFGSDISGLIEARKKTEYEKWKKEEEARQNKEEADKLEQERLYNVEQFLSTIPTVFANDEEKEGWRNQINANEYMTTEEKTKALQDLRKIQTGKAAAQQARQDARTQDVRKNTEKKLDEKTEKKKLADAGRKAIQEGKVPTRKQKKAIDEGY